MSSKLSGLRVCVTRASHQSDALSRLLAAEGATVVPCPVISVSDPSDWGPFDAALDAQQDYDACLIGSQNAVAALTKRDRTLSIPVVAVGKKTASLLKGAWVPVRNDAEGMVALLSEKLAPLAGRRFLFLRAPSGREAAIDALEAAGATVDAVTAYEIALVTTAPAVDADVYTFMSGETLSAFLDVVPDARERLASGKVVVIGPVAAGRAAALGVRVDGVAAERSAESMVAVVLELASSARGG